MNPAAPPRALDGRPLLCRELLDGLDHGVCIVHIVCDAAGRPCDYRIVDDNPAFEEHTGLRDAIGRTVLEMVPAIEPFWIDTYGGVGISGEPVRFEHRAEGLDGGWFEVYAWRIGQPAERLVAISFRNVKQRKLADAEREQLLRAVQAERRRLADVFDIAPSFMAVLGGREHRFLSWNAQYQALIGERDPTGRTVAELLPEAVEQGFVTLLDRVYDSGVPYRGSDTLFVRKPSDGGGDGLLERYIDFVYQPTRDSNGAISGIFVQGIDITDRKLAEDALRDADRRKDEFLATLAHELRNPLAPVMSSLAVLDRIALQPDAGEPPAAAAARATMWRQVRQMVRLIDDLLDVSRITRGLIELRKERVEIGAVVQQAAESIAPAIQAAGQQLVTALPPAPLWLQADPARLVQVLGNLLGNASRYSPRGALVRISAGLDGAEVAIAVEDDGAGIPAAALDSIFGLFTQLDHPMARSSGGLGIGLYLVRRLAELHGGRVHATSGGPGQGSRFVLHLPAEAPADAVPAAADGPPAAPAGRSRRVLIADDNVDAAQSMALLLEIDGHVTHTVADGLQAVAAVEAFAPDVIVLDIGMPGLDGYAACRRIRALPGGGRLIIVALTGWGHDDDKRKSREAGFDGHLVKPVGPESLHALLQECERGDDGGKSTDNGAGGAPGAGGTAAANG